MNLEQKQRGIRAFKYTMHSIHAAGVLHRASRSLEFTLCGRAHMRMWGMRTGGCSST